MSPRNLPLSRLSAALVCVLAAGSVRAELIKVSPFLPPQSAGNAPTANAPLEYRGVMEMGDVEQYRVVDPAHKVGTWLRIGEKDANLDVVVKQHNPEPDTITVEHGGQTMTLPLKTAKIVSAGTAPQIMPMPVPPPAQNVSPAVLQTVVPNPTPADEQRRLEAVAAEVARRRALREQAAQQQQQQQATGGPQVIQQPNATREDLQQAQQQMQQGVRRQ